MGGLLNGTLAVLVVGDGDVGVLEHVAGQDARHGAVLGDDALGQQVLETGDRRGGGRLAAQAVLADQGLGVADLGVGDCSDDAVAHVQGAEALLEVDRPRDLDGRGAGVRREVPGRQVRVVVVDDLPVDVAAVPAQALVVDQVP